ncbi:MAG: putative polysaccharide biosynthesis protein [Caldicoprobacterales bacterium]
MHPHLRPAILNSLSAGIDMYQTSVCLNRGLVDLKINTKSLLYGTIVISMANFIVQLLGFAYRVFLSRIIGPQGMGLVQLVYPVFYILVTLTAAGIPVAVSRLISEKNAKGDIRGMRRTMAVALSLVTVISVSLTLPALLNLDLIVKFIIRDERTKEALFILFPCVIFIGLSATLKGFFHGQKNIHPPALAEITEQITRMTVAIGLILWLAPGENFALAAVLVMIGAVIGEMSGLLYLHIHYNKAKKDLKLQWPYIKFSRKLSFGTNSIKKTARAIAAIALPITATSLINSVMFTANSLLIPQRLAVSGLTREQALDLFGIFSGMVMPLFFLPFTITNALSVVIIPNLAESRALNRWQDIKSKINRAIQLTCYIAFPSAALLAALGGLIGDLLYRQPLVATLLIPLSYALPIHALQHTSSSILNGLGRQNQAAAHFIAGSFIQLICTWFLAANPAINIWGMVIGFTLSSLTVCTANLVTLLKTAKLPFRFPDWIMKPGAASLLMGFSSGTVYKMLSVNEIPALLNLIISAGTGFILFLLCLRVIKGIPARSQHLF